MQFRRALLPVAGVVLLAGLCAGGAGAVGIVGFDPAADTPHWGITVGFIRLMLDRGIAVRSADVTVPNLEDPELIRSGAGNYDAMCVGCHLSPGQPAGEIQKGMYPSPPNFSKADGLDPVRTFWVTKHGIKMTGMPAWGQSMDNAPIWGMTAFVLKLPSMTAEEYTALVASSGGHDHGGGANGHEMAGGDASDAAATATAPHGADHPHGDSPSSAAPAAMDHGKMRAGDSMAGMDAGAGSSGMAGMDHSKMAAPSGTGHAHAAGMEHGNTSGMAGMDHGNTSGMAGMDHGNTSGISGMDKANTSGMAGMDHGNTSGMAGMDKANMPGMSGMDHSKMTPRPVATRRRVSGPAEVALQVFTTALQVGNAGLALSVLAPELVVTEDGHAEGTRDEYAAGHMKADMDFLKNAQVTLLSREVAQNGSEATIVSETQIVSTRAGEEADIISRETATLRPTGDGWKIVRLEWTSRPAGAPKR